MDQWKLITIRRPGNGDRDCGAARCIGIDDAFAPVILGA
jgi:hypothetical protein